MHCVLHPESLYSGASGQITFTHLSGPKASLKKRPRGPTDEMESLLVPASPGPTGPLVRLCFHSQTSCSHRTQPTVKTSSSPPHPPPPSDHSALRRNPKLSNPSPPPLSTPPHPIPNTQPPKLAATKPERPTRHTNVHERKHLSPVEKEAGKERKDRMSVAREQ